MVMALRTLGSPDVGWEVPAGKPAFYNLCVPFFLYTSSLRESRNAKGKQGKAESITKTLPGMAGFFGLLE